jgi:hypothetical protein
MKRQPVAKVAPKDRLRGPRPRSHELPRLRDWKQGQYQIGVFVRTKEGSTVSLVRDEATPDEAAFCFHLITALRKLPPEIVAQVRAAWEATSKDKL